VTELEVLHVDRFFERVRIGRGPDACWIWTGEKQSQKRRPYGLFDYNEGGKKRRVVAHKFAFHSRGRRDRPHLPPFPMRAIQTPRIYRSPKQCSSHLAARWTAPPEA